MVRSVAAIAPALGLSASWNARSLACYMLLVAIVRHPTTISIAWSGMQLAAQGGTPRGLDSLIVEANTLLCLLVALHCFQGLLERLSKHWWMHVDMGIMSEAARLAIRPLR